MSDENTALTRLTLTLKRLGMKEMSPLLWGKAKNIKQLPLLPQASEDESELEAGIGPMCQAACAGLLPTSTRQPSPRTQVGVSASVCPRLNSQASLMKRLLFILGALHSLRF